MTTADASVSTPSRAHRPTSWWLAMLRKRALRMYDEELLLTSICHAGVSRGDLDDFVTAVAKVYDHRQELR